MDHSSSDPAKARGYSFTPRIPMMRPLTKEQDAQLKADLEAVMAELSASKEVDPKAD